MRSPSGAITILGSAAILAVACRVASDAPDAPPNRPHDVHGAVSAPFDVGAIPRTFHFAFRRDEGGTLVAGHASHLVRASAGGFSLAPIDVAPPGVHARGGAPSSALDVGAATITCGGAPCARPPGEPRIDRDGALLVDRGDVVEHLQNGERGVEQSWTFAHAPATAGDVVLRLPVHGEAFVAKTATGLHFRDPKAARGVAYGAATFVDARGIRTRIESAFDGEEIVLRVPSDVAAASAYPATLDPNVSPEREVDQPIFVSYAPGVNAAPAIDVEGSRYFVVWADDRTTYGDGVFGIHVAQDGTPVEAAPITIARGFPGGAATSPAYDGTAVVAVAFDGTNHLVAYTDQRDGHLAISARRVSSAGAVLDGAPIAVSPAIAADAVSPSVAFTGSAYMVAWSDGRNAPASTSDVFAARVSAGGSVLEASSIPVSHAPGNNVYPKLAAQGGGGDVFVVWSRDVNVDLVRSAVYGALLTSSGIVVAPDVLVAPAPGTIRDDFRPDVAASGGSFLVSYLEQFIAVADPVHGAPAFTPGTFAGPAVTVVSSAGVPGAALGGVLPSFMPPVVNGVPMFSTPRVAYDGTSFSLAWSANNQLYLQAISTAGALVGSPSSLSINDDEQTAPGGAAIAASPAGTMTAAHTRLVTGEGAVFASAVTPGDAGSALGAPRMLSQGANAELLADAALLGTNTLVVWVDSRNAATTSDDVYGVLLDANGNGVGGAAGGVDAGYPLADAFPIVTTSGPDGPVAVAADDQGYLVAFGTTVGQFLDVGVKRVTAQGQLAFDTAASPGTTAGGSGSPGFAQVDVCWDGSTFLVVGALPGGTGSENIFGRHITRTSAGAPSLVESNYFPALTQGANRNDTQPLVASQGSGQSFVVFRDASSNLVGTFVSNPLPASPITPFAVASGITGAALVYDTVGQSYRVAWVSNTTPATLSFLSATTSSMSGARLVPATPFAGSAPALGFDGKESLLAWADQRGGPASLDVYGARIDLAGALVDGAGFPIAADPQAIESLPVVSGIGGGASLVTYVKYAADQSVVRRYARIVSTVQSEALGASCTTSGDCASGFCVDGVCCDQACGGGSQPSCGVCAAALGATSDGTCTARRAGSVCRASGGDCDLSETCDGTSVACPPDVPASNGTLCSAGVCVGGMCVASFDAGPPDAGADSATDAGSDAGDAGDAAPDAASDAAPDAPVDAAGDAPVDAPPPVDAGTDAAPRDAAADARGDAAPDAAPDAGSDSGPPIVVLDGGGIPEVDASFEPFPPADDGCSCRAAGDRSRGAAGGFAALFVLLAFGAARRRPRA